MVPKFYMYENYLEGFLKHIADLIMVLRICISNEHRALLILLVWETSLWESLMSYFLLGLREVAEECSWSGGTCFRGGGSDETDCSGKYKTVGLWKYCWFWLIGCYIYS